MKIKILNGSPRKENTTAMCEAFAEGAKEAGHDVEILHVGSQVALHVNTVTERVKANVFSRMT